MHVTLSFSHLHYLTPMILYIKGSLCLWMSTICKVKEQSSIKTFIKASVACFTKLLRARGLKARFSTNGKIYANCHANCQQSGMIWGNV